MSKQVEKVKRRKWTYPSREEAERAADRYRSAEIDYSIFLDAVLNAPESIKWHRGRHYEIGRWGATRADGGLYGVRFLAPDNPGQKPHTTVMTRQKIDAWRRTLGGIPGSDKEASEIRDLIDKATMAADAELRESLR